MDRISRGKVRFWRRAEDEKAGKQANYAEETDGNGTQIEAPSPTGARHSTGSRPQRLSHWVLAIALIIVGTFFLLFFRYPVVINSPGPTFDVLGKNRSGIPLIEIKGTKTYPEGNGQLRMTTVSSLGGPGSVVNGLDIILAGFNPNSEILPEEAVYPRQLTSKDIKTIGLQQMDQSQLAAEAVALKSLGYQINITWVTAEVPKESPAFGKLRKDDVLESITTHDSPPTPITTIEELHKFLARLAPGTEVTLNVTREGHPLTLKFPTMKATSRKGSQLGVLLSAKVNIPLDINFHLQDVGGPSAGTMFALGIVEQLTPQKITSRHPVAGTGTIDFAGKVGPISGIPQKMAGAKKDGAKFFLAPAANCAEAVEHIPTGLRVTPVATFSDALRALELIRENRETDLPSCPPSKQKLS